MVRNVVSTVVVGLGVEVVVDVDVLLMACARVVKNVDSVVGLSV